MTFTAFTQVFGGASDENKSKDFTCLIPFNTAWTLERLQTTFWSVLSPSFPLLKAKADVRGDETASSGLSANSILELEIPYKRKEVKYAKTFSENRIQVICKIKTHTPKICFHKRVL